GGRGEALVLDLADPEPDLYRPRSHKGNGGGGGQFPPPDGFPNATLVHDGWRPQKGTPAENHQTCPAHLLRHLEYLGELYRDNPWPRDFARLLRDAIDISKEVGPPEPAIKRAWIVQRLEGLLDRPPDKGLKELFTFYRRMCRERQQLFTFLFLPGLPPDNNASERAIRNIKVKQKISGQFKKDRSAHNFAMIRSVIDTTIKNGMKSILYYLIHNFRLKF